MNHCSDGQTSFWISPPKHLDRSSTRFRAAIDAYQAMGYESKDALVLATMSANSEDPSAWPEDQASLPYVSPTPLSEDPKPFKACQLGFYPIVDNSDWLKTLLPLGVKCIQLRIKELQGAKLVSEIKHSIALAKEYQALLFINDYWELALEYGAPGIHLGQEDLAGADLDAIRAEGICLGVSTHGYYEVAVAHTLNPSYIACGPIYPTTSKVMAAQAQGILQLQRWRRTLNYPLVAIGGINLERLPQVLNTGVEGISVISAITKAENPVEATKQFLSRMALHNHV